MLEVYKNLKNSLEHRLKGDFGRHGYIASPTQRLLKSLSHNEKTHTYKHVLRAGSLLDTVINNEDINDRYSSKESAFLTDEVLNGTLIAFLEDNLDEIYKGLEHTMENDNVVFKDVDIFEMHNTKLKPSKGYCISKNQKDGTFEGFECKKANVVIKRRSNAPYGFVFVTAYPTTRSSEPLPPEVEEKFLNDAKHASKLCRDSAVAKSYVDACTNGNKLPHSQYIKPQYKGDEGQIIMNKVKRGEYVSDKLRPRGDKCPPNRDVIAFNSKGDIKALSYRTWNKLAVSPYDKENKYPVVSLAYNKDALNKYVSMDKKFGNRDIKEFATLRKNILENIEKKRNEIDNFVEETKDKELESNLDTTLSC